MNRALGLAVGALLMLALCFAAVELRSRIARKTETLLHVGLILLLFALSVGIRSAYLNRPLSYHHEWVTAQSMIALENLTAQGAIKHKFAIVQTYPREADKFVKDRTVRAVNREGYGYYTSFPPFSIILPYAVFTLLAVTPTVLNLQIFNLGFHLLAAIVLYLALKKLFGRAAGSGTAALMGSAFFIFLAPSLWYFSNVYSWDTFWHYLWVGAIYYTLIIDDAIREDRLKPVLLYGFGVLMFLLCYSENQGLFYAAAVVLYCVFQSRRHKRYRAVAGVVAVAAAFAPVLTFLQYAYAAGLDSLLAAHRAAMSRATYGPDDYSMILKHYYVAYSYVIYPLLLTWALLGVKSLRELMLSRWTWLSLFTVLAHHAIFLRWSNIHDYSVLKTSVFLCFVAAFYCYQALTKPIGRITAAAVLAIWAGTLFFSVERYRGGFAEHPNVSVFQDVGQRIRESVEDDEVVFSTLEVEPQVVYYAGRNIQPVADREAAIEWLESHHRERGKIFYIDKAFRLIGMEAIDARSATFSTAAH
jgi:hypothetical protein